MQKKKKIIVLSLTLKFGSKNSECHFCSVCMNYALGIYIIVFKSRSLFCKTNTITRTGQFYVFLPKAVEASRYTFITREKKTFYYIPSSVINFDIITSDDINFHFHFLSLFRNYFFFIKLL